MLYTHKHTVRQISGINYNNTFTPFYEFQRKSIQLHFWRCLHRKCVYSEFRGQLWLSVLSSSSSWRRRKQALRGLCIREIDVESQTLVIQYYSKLRFGTQAGNTVIDIRIR